MDAFLATPLGKLALTVAHALAMAEAGQREAAMVTFLVTASGFTLFSVGSAFWGLVAGLAVAGLDRLKKK